MAKYSGPGGDLVTDVRYKYLHNLLPGQVFREMEFVESRKEWNKHAWNQFELKEMGIYYCMTALISKHGIWSDYISVNRLKSKGPNTDQEKADLGTLLPHLAKAGELHRLVTKLEEKHRAVLSVLDKFLVGLIILDKKGRVAISNLAAKEISSDSGAYAFTQDGYLSLFRVDMNLKLKELMDQTNQTSTRGGHSDGGHMVIKNRSNGDDLLLEIMPIRDDGFSDRDNIRGTAVFVMDPGRSKIFSTEGLKSIFNLTQSESDVVDSLVNGLSVNQIAEARNTNADTVRGQLKSAYFKTGTSSQLDLLRKVVKANPPIEGVKSGSKG